MKIHKRILTIFGIAVITSLYFFYFIFHNHDKVIENSSELIQTQKVLNNIDSISYSLADLESNARRFILTDKPAFELGVQNNISLLNRKSGELKKLAKENTKESSIIAGIVEGIAQKIQTETEALSASSTPQKGVLEIIEANKDQDNSYSLTQSLTSLKDIYSAQLNDQIVKSNTISKSNFNSSLIIGFFTIVFIAVILYQVNRYMLLRKVVQKEALLKEIKYRRFFEDSGLILLTTDLKGNINFVNKRAKYFTGFEPEEIIGKHFSLLVDKEWVPVINNNFEKQIKTREFELQIEFPLKIKSDKRIWVEQSSIILYENEVPSGFQCIVKDITEKKKLESEAKIIELEREENQYRLQSILDNTTLIIYIKDLEGRYLLVNKKYKDFFQFSEGQAIGKTDFDLLEDEEAQRNYDIDQYVIREKKNIEMEVESYSPIDGKHNLLLVRFPLFDKNQNIYGIGGIATDITERLIYSKHLMEAKGKAELAEQLQEQFLANMSHEIRTPMNGIIGMTNILIDSPLSDEQKDFVQIIKKSSDNLLVLINDILDLSKIKAGKLGIENIDFNLREVIENTLAPFKTKVLEKRINMDVDINYSIPEKLIGDPHRLNQILTNLMSNAIKFTEKGKINLGLKLLNLQADKVTLEFTVSDTGIGISNDKLQFIFESFTQAETGITRRFGGTGLGLSITKKLIELQQGSIDVTSFPDQGTTFTFVLNYGVASLIQQKQNKEEIVIQERATGNDLNGKKILVVEDNETNQKVIYHMLKKVGVVSTITDNGKEAAKLLEKGYQFDLVIMDLQMPEMNGFETTIYIRNKLNLSIPIIAMTASALRNEKMKCLELGMNEYFTKPFVPAELYRILRKYLLKNEEADLVSAGKNSLEKGEEEKLYDLELLLEMDDVECLNEVLQMFLDTTPVMLDEIAVVIAEKNWEQVYKKCHKLKSSIGLLKMKKFLSVITKMESDARDQVNLNEIIEGYKRAEILFTEIKPMIEAELKNTNVFLVKN